MDTSKNNGVGLSGDRASLQNLPGGSTPTHASTYVTFNGLGWPDHKAAYIALRKALTALKRGKPTDYDLEVLGCSVDEFNDAHRTLVLNEVMVKLRVDVTKKLEKLGLL